MSIYLGVGKAAGTSRQRALGDGETGSRRTSSQRQIPACRLPVQCSFLCTELNLVLPTAAHIHLDEWSYGVRGSMRYYDIYGATWEEAQCDTCS